MDNLKKGLSKYAADLAIIAGAAAVVAGVVAAAGAEQHRRHGQDQCKR